MCQIGAFIERKRREGFAVVAVEQTSESVALHEFEFPRKSVLLLGNERAGIPVELIGLVDHCVRLAIPATWVVIQLQCAAERYAERYAESQFEKDTCVKFLFWRHLQY